MLNNTLMAYLLNPGTDNIGVVHPQLYDCLVRQRSIQSYIDNVTNKQHLLFPMRIGYHWSHVVVIIVNTSIRTWTMHIIVCYISTISHILFQLKKLVLPKNKICAVFSFCYPVGIPDIDDDMHSMYNFQKSWTWYWSLVNEKQ